MRIALDARTIFAPQRRGIGKSLLQLYRHLAMVRPDWQVIAFHRCPNPDPSLLPDDVTQLRLVEMPGDRFDAWIRWRLPTAAWRNNADVLHCPANHCPQWMPQPTVVTIHDLIPLDDSAQFPAAEVRRFAGSVRCAARRAAAVICPSAYTRDRLINEFDINRRRVIVNPWGVDPQYLNARLLGSTVAQQTLERYGIKGPYVLHYGSSEQRKNTRRLLQAWSHIQHAADIPHKLVVVGLDGDGQAAMTQLAFQLGISSSVFLHGFAAEADLPALLAKADVLAYPSESEGFGLPILEAFATKTAVLCANRTSLPQVAGDAALLVDPFDVGNIASGLLQLIQDSELRNELIDRGGEQLSQYTWQACAKRFALTLESVAGQTVKQKVSRVAA